MFYRLLYEISQHDRLIVLQDVSLVGRTTQREKEGKTLATSMSASMGNGLWWTEKKFLHVSPVFEKKKIKKNESYKRSHIYHRLLARIFAHIRQRLSLHSPQAAHPGTSILRTGLRIPWIAKLRFAAAASGRTRGRWTRPVSMECISSWGCSHLRT